jgi:hypothetical protein
MVSWVRSGATFLGYSGKIGGSGGSAAGGVFFLIDTSAKPQIWVAHLGHNTSDFAICEFVDLWQLDPILW